MSTITYNDVELELVQTNRYTCTPIYSADGMDYLYTSHFYDFNCIYNPKATSYDSGGPTDNSLPADTFAAIRHRLLQPRGTLVIDHGGAGPLIFSPGPVGGAVGQGQLYECDVNGGPFNRGLYVVKLGGNHTWTVNIRVETFLLECPMGDPTALISNRYSQASNLDETYMTSLITEGVAVFRQDLLEFTGSNADAFRDQILPPIPAGFRREGIRVVVQPQRNQIHYSVMDRERYFDLGDTNPDNSGSGVIDVQAVYRVAGVKPEKGGGLASMTHESVEVHVKGYKTASMWRLTQYCINLARSKLPIGDHVAGFITDAAISQNLTNKSVSFQISMRINATPGGKVGVLNSAQLKTDLVFADQGGLNPAPPNDSGTRGHHTAELTVAALKAACGVPRVTRVGPPDQGSSVADYDYTAPTDVQVIVGGDVLPDLPRAFSYQQISAPFTDYHIDTRYDTHRGVLVAPVGSSGASAGSGGTPTPPEFLTVHEPYSTMIVEGTAERVNVMPLLPKSIVSSPNLVLLERVVTGAAPELQGDGQTYVYHATFRYVYGLRTPLDDSTPLPFGASPMYTAFAEQNVFPPEGFVEGILPEPQGGGQSSGQSPAGPDGPIGPSV